MPLRDHFRPPVWKQASWEGFHGCWPMTMVQQLSRRLPENFSAEPRVHLGTFLEIDDRAYDGVEAAVPSRSTSNGAGGIATATWAPPQPTLAVDSDLAAQYEYEVLVFDQDR